MNIFSNTKEVTRKVILRLRNSQPFLYDADPHSMRYELGASRIRTHQRSRNTGSRLPMGTTETSRNGKINSPGEARVRESVKRNNITIHVHPPLDISFAIHTLYR